MIQNKDQNPWKWNLFSVFCSVWVWGLPPPGTWANIRGPLDGVWALRCFTRQTLKGAQISIEKFLDFSTLSFCFDSLRFCFDFASFLLRVDPHWPKCDVIKTIQKWNEKFEKFAKSCKNSSKLAKIRQILSKFFQALNNAPNHVKSRRNLSILAETCQNSSNLDRRVSMQFKWSLSAPHSRSSDGDVRILCTLEFLCKSLSRHLGVKCSQIFVWKWSEVCCSKNNEDLNQENSQIVQSTRFVKSDHKCCGLIR